MRLQYDICPYFFCVQIYIEVFSKPLLFIICIQPVIVIALSSFEFGGTKPVPMIQLQSEFINIQGFLSCQLISERGEENIIQNDRFSTPWCGDGLYSNTFDVGVAILHRKKVFSCLHKKYTRTPARRRSRGCLEHFYTRDHRASLL